MSRFDPGLVHRWESTNLPRARPGLVLASDGTKSEKKCQKMSEIHNDCSESFIGIPLFHINPNKISAFLASISYSGRMKSLTYSSGDIPSC